MITEKNEIRPIIIIDGLNFFIRHFTANPTMSENGEQMGGFVGFLGGVASLCEKFNPSRLIVVWESGGNTKRRNIMGGYKQARRPMKLNRYYEDDLPDTKENHTRQISMLVELFKHVPVTQIYVKDCEADDVIGYVSKYLVKDDEAIIVSSDKDYHQLITKNVKQYSPFKKCLLDEDYVKSSFGVSPTNFITARVFVGDPSDKIEGVDGVGFKTLSKHFPQLLSDEFVSYEDVIHSAQLCKRSKSITNIIISTQTASKNWKLMNLSTNTLSSDQIKKINEQFEHNEHEINKMSFMRIMHQNGLQKIDINRQFSSIVNVLKQTKG